MKTHYYINGEKIVYMDIEEFARFSEEKGVNGIILPNGEIMDALWGHVNRLVEIAGGKQVWDIVPIEAGAILWLVDYTSCISVSEESVFLPESPTKEQVNTLSDMFDNHILHKKCNLCQGFERSRMDSILKMRANGNCTHPIIEPKQYQSIEEILAL